MKNVLKMVKNCEFRKKMSDNAMRLVDGKGIERIAKKLDEEILKQLKRQLIEYKNPLDPISIEDWNVLKK